MSLLPLPHTVIRFDIVGSSVGKRARQMRLDDGLRTVLDAAIADVPLRLDGPAWFRRTDGDSGHLVVPASVPKAWLVADFIRSVEIHLRQYNRFESAGSRLRLRGAIAHGDVIVREVNINGEPVAEAARLVDSDVLRTTMQAYRDADLILIVTERFFTEVVDEGDLDLDPSRFDKILATAKDYSRLAYIRRPESAADAERSTAPAPVSPGTDGRPPSASRIVTASGHRAQAAGENITITHNH